MGCWVNMNFIAEFISRFVWVVLVVQLGTSLASASLSKSAFKESLVMADAVQLMVLNSGLKYQYRCRALLRGEVIVMAPKINGLSRPSFILYKDSTLLVMSLLSLDQAEFSISSESDSRGQVLTFEGNRSALNLSIDESTSIECIREII